MLSRQYIHAHSEQKIKFSIKDFVSKCDQIRRKLPIWSHLLNYYYNFIYSRIKKSLKICIHTIHNKQR